jgi:hypothetical protein
MASNLTTSSIARQNILNNNYAIEEAINAIGLKGVLFEGEYKFTKQEVADFFEVTPRTISMIISKYGDEIEKNGYGILTGNRLKEYKLALSLQYDEEKDFPIKTYKVGVFNYRALLNIGMILSNSQKAKELRSLILDIVIDTINKRTGGSTKYINQRDEDFVINLVSGFTYHVQFINALTNYVDMGKWKYPLYTNKIYISIFKEDATEYRKILKLEEQDGIRDTMYSEVLDLISSYETGFADMLKNESERLGRMLSESETSHLFHTFESMKLWEPLREKARTKMASRDLCFRDALHQNLQEYVKSVPRDYFDRFIGQKSMSLDERLEEYKEALKRLKERE